MLIDTIESILSRNVLDGNFLIVAGDLNINILDVNSNSVKNYISMMTTLNFSSLIDKPTRFPSENSNLNSSNLDHIWDNQESVLNSGIVYLDQTDHCPTFIIFSIPKNITENYIKTLRFRPFSNSKFNRIFEFSRLGFCIGLFRRKSS